MPVVDQAQYDRLVAQRTAIQQELDNMEAKPSYTKSDTQGSQSFQWTEYRRALLDQLKYLDLRILQLEGPTMIVSHARA